jgi:hypothetical protein
MKKLLKQTNNTIYHFVNGVRIEGSHSDISGNVSYIRGNVSDISGNVTSISGNLDECEITDEERYNGINIKDLIE